MKTVSLELSKKLKKAGFPQEPRYSHFAWFIAYTGEGFLETNIEGKGGDEPSYFAAPTAEEILDELPAVLKDSGYEVMLKIYKRPLIKYVLKYGKYDTVQGDSLAEAAGKMWLYLKKEGLI